MSDLDESLGRVYCDCDEVVPMTFDGEIELIKLNRLVKDVLHFAFRDIVNWIEARKSPGYSGNDDTELNAATAYLWLTGELHPRCEIDDGLFGVEQDFITAKECMSLFNWDYLALQNRLFRMVASDGPLSLKALWESRTMSEILKILDKQKERRVGLSRFIRRSSLPSEN